jgi:hypothetical protein
MKNTPLKQFIRDFCPNHQPDGRCIGVTIRDDGSLARFRRARAAGLQCNAESSRCPHFEKCIAPGVKSMPEGLEAKNARAALHEYRMNTNATTAARLCPPPCGKPIEPAKQLCPTCRERREKASRRDRQQRWRNGGSDVDGKSKMEPCLPMACNG